MIYTIEGTDRPSRACSLLACMRGYYEVRPNTAGRIDDGWITVEWDGVNPFQLGAVFWLRVREWVKRHQLHPVFEIVFFKDGSFRAEAYRCGAGFPAEYARRLLCDDVGQLINGKITKIESPFAFYATENEGVRPKPKRADDVRLDQGRPDPARAPT